MFNKCFSKNVVISMGNSSFPLVHAHSRRVKGRSMTSVSTSDNSVFVFFNSCALDNPIVCKIKDGVQGVKFTSVSPTLEQLLSVSNNSQVSVISLKEVLDYDSTSHISISIDKSKFPPSAFNPSNFEPAHFYNSIFLQPTKDIITNAFWWKLPGNFFDIILVGNNGFTVVSLHDIENPTFNFQIDDIICTDFRQINNTVQAIVCCKKKVLLCEFYEENRIINIKKTDLHISLDPNAKIFIQMGQADSDQLVTIVQNEMITLDNKLRKIKLTDIEINSSDIEGFSLTKHFMFVLSSGTLRAWFLNDKKQTPIEIAKDVVQLSVTDFENDLLIYTTVGTAEILSFNGDPYTFATNIVKEKRLEDAKVIVEAFNFDMNSVILHAIEELCNDDQLFLAIELTDFLTCSAASAIKIFIRKGSERSALHIVRRKPIEKTQKIIHDLMEKIYAKMSIFPLFERIYSTTNNKMFSYPSPEEFAQTGLLENLKNNERSFLDLYPASLIFHIQTKNNIEANSYEILRDASPLDIPDDVSMFSRNYATLLKMMKKVLPKTEEELPYPILTHIGKIRDSILYVSNNKLFYNNKEVLSNVSTFVAFQEKVYILQTTGDVLQTNDMVNFSTIDVIPALKIAASDTHFCILSIAGPIFYINNTSEDFRVIEGSYADLCTGKSIYAIDEEGQLLDVLQNNRVLYNEKFVREAVCSKNSIVCSVVGNDFIIVDGETTQSIDIGFKAEIIKGGEKVIIAGEGKIEIIDSQERVTKEYSRRMGSLKDVFIDDDGTLIVSGSSSTPIRILKEHIDANKDADLFEELLQIYKNFSEQILFGIFKSQKYTTILSILYKKWNLLSGDLMWTMPYLDKLEVGHASEAFHNFILRKVFDGEKAEELPKYLSKEFSRKCFIKYPKDLNIIPQKYLISVIQNPRKAETGETGMKLLQMKASNPVTFSGKEIPKENSIVFSCGHSYDRKNLDKLTKKFVKESRAKFIKNVSQSYSLDKIPMQCPICLQSELEHSKLM